MVLAGFGPITLYTHICIYLLADRDTYYSDLGCYGDVSFHDDLIDLFVWPTYVIPCVKLLYM